MTEQNTWAEPATEPQTAQSLQREIRQTNASKGWGKGFQMDVQENPVVLLALIGTELREATDEMSRSAHEWREESAEVFSKASLELGDAVVRTLDLASLIARESPGLRNLNFSFPEPAPQVTPLTVSDEELTGLYARCAAAVQDGRRHGPEVYLTHLEGLLGHLSGILARHGRDAAQIVAYLNARNAGRDFKHGGARY